MISERTVKEFCNEDISLIENYEQAIQDKVNTWHCHHKLGLGSDYENTIDELKMMNLYYNRPACEFIFITEEEHHRIHSIGKHNGFYGKTHTNESKNKISKSKQGYKHTEDWKENQSKVMKELHKNGREEVYKKISETKRNSDMSYYKKNMSLLGKANKGKTWKLINGKRVWMEV